MFDPTTAENASANGELIYENCSTIVSQLLRQGDQSDRHDSEKDDVESDDEVTHRKPHLKPDSDVSDWVDSIGFSTDFGPSEGSQLDTDQGNLPGLSEYKVFVKSSESYRWLVSRLWQHGRLSFGDRDTKSDIGSGFRERLRALESLRKMSTRRPLSKVHAKFLLQWHPTNYLEDHGQDRLFPRTLDDILCVTGSWYEAQATTIAEYMRQTWPVTGEAVIKLFEQLVQAQHEGNYVCEYPSRSAILKS
jgi:hypothetical protein